MGASWVMPVWTGECFVFAVCLTFDVPFFSK